MTNENSILADSTTNLTSPAKGKVQQLKNEEATEDSAADDFGVNSEREKERNPLNPNGASAKDKERALIVSITQSRPRETWDQKVEFLLAVIGFAVDLGVSSYSRFNRRCKIILFFRTSGDFLTFVIRTVAVHFSFLIA